MKTRPPMLRFGVGRAHSQGLAAVEFVVTVPVLIVVMLAIAEIGHALVQFDTLSYSVRSSARYVSENVIPGDSGTISDQLIADVQDEARNLVVYGTVTESGDPPLLPNGEATAVTASSAGTFDIEVVAVYPYVPLVASILPGFDMRVAVTMRAIS